MSVSGMTTDPDFGSYVRARYEHLLRAAVLMCGDVHHAQELVQEALIKLAKHWGRVSQGYPDAYVRRIIYHDNIARARKVRLEVVSEALPEVAGVTFVEGWVATQDVRRALQQLPPRQRATVVLRYFEDLTEAQAAEAMGVTVGTVKSQTHLALARMKELLGPDWGTSSSAHRRTAGTPQTTGARVDDRPDQDGEGR